jgi:murein DD-endopeptidase MepM/ murein hydrolase activator NlpD
LENREKKTQLDIEQNELQISKTELEVRRLQEEIKQTHKIISSQKDIIRDVLQELYVYGDDSPLEIVFGNEAFSDYFDQLQYLELLQDDLQTSIDSVQLLQDRLSAQSEQEVEHKERLLSMRDSLHESRRLLEEEQRSKDVLLAQTERSEAQFRVLLRELRGEQQYINAEVFRLQQRLEQQFEENDAIPDGPTVMSWPVQDPILTATYHDPTYPFRHLFEHSGLDMAIPQGSVVRAAAPGYVAWTRTGRSYGNYIMIIHTNGMSTLYAHLSGFNVSADQFVERGQQIATSGGMPGTAGAGLSTGPHLHFEVREQGIPVNPLNYLVSQ